MCLSVCLPLCLPVCLCLLTHDVDEGAAEDGVEAAEHRVGDPPSEHRHEVARTCGRENIQDGWDARRVVGRYNRNIEYLGIRIDILRKVVRQRYYFLH